MAYDNGRGTLRQKGTSRGLSSIKFEEDESLVSYAENRYENRDSHRLALERQWFLNIAQYVGLQYHVFDNQTRTLAIDSAPPHRVRLVCNRLMMQVRKSVSKFIRQRPEWTVVPATGDQEDQVKAVLGNRVLRAYWRSQGMDWKLVDAAFWLFTTGNVFLRVVWDPSKGDPTDIGLDDLQPDADARSRDLVKAGIKTGDLSIDVVNPFELDPDPTALSLDQASHVLHTKLVPIADLRARYGAKATEGISPDTQDDEGLTSYFTKKLRTLTGPGGLSGRGEENGDDTVRVHTAWCNPHGEYPKGYYFVVAGGKLLHKAKELPNPFYRAPFVHLVETMVPGRFWATSMLEQSLGLQADYNRARSQMCESRNLFSKPKVLAPKGHGLPMTSFDSEPGEFLEYNAGAKPEPWTPPPLPEYVMRGLDLTLKDMEDISGVHEVTQARAPSGVRSGTAIQSLQEMDDQLLGPTFLLAEKSLGTLGGWSLALVAKNVTEPRILKIVGRENGYDAFTFLGQDLMGPNQGRAGVNYYDVEVHMGSQLPRSPAARNQQIMDMIDRGLLDVRVDRKRIFELLELTEEPLLNEGHLDMQNARREDWSLRQEIFIEINPWDDDEIHIEVHNRDRKQPDYLQTTTPLARQLHEMHVQMHQERRAARMAPPPVAQPGQAEGQPAGMPIEGAPI